MNGWTITTVNAVGTGSSQATIINRDSPWMVVNVLTDSSNFAVQLPVSSVTAGDLVEVSVGSSFANPAIVWFGATVLDSSTTHWEEVGAGRSRFYRSISGSLWNRYT